MTGIEQNQLNDTARENDNVIQSSDMSPSDSQFTITETKWSELKAVLDKRYTEIATLLRYNKTKDESIQRLSAEIQKYREGFAFSALKPFLNALISLREDCHKSMRDSKHFEMDGEKAKKYTEYLVSDFEEMLSNIGLERDDDNSISINGKPISGQTQPKTMPSEYLINEQKNDDTSPVLISTKPIKNMSELFDYLNKNEMAIQLALQDKAVTDKTIQEYRELSARTDAEHYFALVAPISRQVYKLYDSITVQSANDISDDMLIIFYQSILDKVVHGIEIILINAGMEIESLDGFFDVQKNKLLKTIPTSDEKLDRIIANTYTDCYIYDGKIIYQSKVDVYKFQQTQGEENHG